MWLKLVCCEKEYWDFVLLLRNNLSSGFIEQKTISVTEHYNFMEMNHTSYYIALDNNIPVGWVGQINGDIRVATHPDHQNKGVGKFMINQLMKIYPNAFAKVKLENEASLKLFESCGFKKKFYILENQ